MENDNTFTIEEPSELPYNLLILPLGTKPLFPGMFAPLYITGENDITIVNQAMMKGGIFGAILEKPHKENESFVNAADRFYPVGTSCKILKTLKMPDGGLNIFVSTLSRFRVESFFSTTTGALCRLCRLDSADRRREASEDPRDSGCQEENRGGPLLHLPGEAHSRDPGRHPDHDQQAAGEEPEGLLPA